MGRALKVQAVRRNHPASEVEALGSSGFWIRQPLWGDETARRCQEWADKINRGVFPGGEFLWGEQDLPDDGDMPTPGQGEGGQGGDADGDAEGQGDGQGDGGITIEDIVRRIAGEMDIDLAAKLGEYMGTQIEGIRTSFDQKLDAFQSKQGGDGVDPLIIKIELNTPNIKLHKDGIFHNQFDKLVKLVATGQHVYLPGPPGTGKSHAAEQVASVLDWRFASISLGPTTPESRLWGGMDAHGKFFEPPFVTLARHAADNPESGSVFCLDELDNGHPGVIATLNSAMANGWFTAPNGDVITMGRNFVIVGAANTFGTGPTAEFAGRNKLDAATLDRFAYVPWDTDLGVEKALVHQYLESAAAKAWLDVWRTCRKNVKDNGLKVFVSMRGAVNGAKLIAQGFTGQEALDMVLLNKLPEEQKRKVRP